jgi:GntR family transcriptional regulator of arabinose operon
MKVSLPTLIARKIIADYVDNDAVKRGLRLPSFRDLKQRYDASNTSIAHALSILDGQGIITRMHGKGCYVARPTEEHGHKHIEAIGFVLPCAANWGEVASRIHAGTQRACRKLGYDAVVTSAEWDYEAERREVIRLAESGCRGIVLYPVSRLPEQLRSDYLNRELPDFPIVLADIAYPEQRRSQVIFDNYGAGLRMTEWLINRGHSHIAFVEAVLPQGEYMHRSTRERYRGYLAALASAGKAPRPEDRWKVLAGMEDPVSEAEDLLRAWMKRPDRPTAVVCLDDHNALAMIHAASYLEICVPDDLQIVGFDGLSIGRSVRASFPTTKPDFELAGETAVQILFQHIRGELAVPVVYMLPVPLDRIGGAAPENGEKEDAVAVVQAESLASAK